MEPPMEVHVVIPRRPVVKLEVKALAKHKDKIGGDPSKLKPKPTQEQANKDKSEGEGNATGTKTKETSGSGSGKKEKDEEDQAKLVVRVVLALWAPTGEVVLAIEIEL